MNDMIKIEKDSGRDMTPRLIRDLGMGYPTEKSSRKYRYGLYECAYCGKEFEARTKDIKTGNTKSCGCQKGGITHGLSYNQFYDTWKNMMGRCSNLKNKHYQSYGGRGISVCTDWQDLANFISWCEDTYIEGMTLDRIDNAKGYSPENCRWVDKTTQNINQRMKSSNTSGFVGIYWHKNVKKWISAIKYQKSHINIGSYLTIEEAVLARDNYIVENKLPHKLSTDYKEEN